ncbi:hypothetical protein BGZ95_000760 [Linnemannia exigua]|uniref:F-box domain-containing protein n=1 Tax=Linnemannia exigua TaxID=604196 RepID=A0AAD4D7U0_9FUNG|nr:hypothetical protein BGZ95_000760 [Linnemannia exigua]
MTTATTIVSPLAIPELRYRISRFVAFKDAFSCALVCKAWTHDFMSVIWFKIDFETQPGFVNLSPDIVSKHGHHIRLAIHVAFPPQISILANAPQVCQLKTFRLNTINGYTPAWVGVDERNKEAFEIVARNRKTLQDVLLWSYSKPYEGSAFLALFVDTPALTPFSGGAAATPLQGRSISGVSNLKSLDLSSLTLSYDDLASILEASPSLTQMALLGTDLVGTPTRSFQHTGLKQFTSGINFIFQIDDLYHTHNPNSPSLLSYFPNLTHLSTWSDNLNFDYPTDKIKKDLDRYCPNLNGFLIAENSSAGISTFCTGIGRPVAQLVFYFESLTAEGVAAILSHKATLTNLELFNTIQGFEVEAYEVAAVSNYFQESSLLLQLLPRECPLLDEFDIFLHEMDMDEVEQGEWVCKDLKTLRIRVKGLDTEEKILKAIALWRKGCWRQRQAKATTTTSSATGSMALLLVDQQDEADYPIEARVARHLLKFEKLEAVWLGYQTWGPI